MNKSFCTLSFCALFFSSLMDASGYIFDALNAPCIKTNLSRLKIARIKRFNALEIFHTQTLLLNEVDVEIDSINQRFNLSPMCQIGDTYRAKLKSFIMVPPSSAIVHKELRAINEEYLLKGKVDSTWLHVLLQLGWPINLTNLDDNSFLPGQVESSFQTYVKKIEQEKSKEEFEQIAPCLEALRTRISDYHTSH